MEPPSSHGPVARDRTACIGGDAATPVSGTVTLVVDTTRRHDVVDLTIVFTDIVGSTQRWESGPHTMRTLLSHHDDVTEQSVVTAGGTVHKHTGDGVIAVFTDPVAALDACVAIHRRLASGPAEIDR